MKILFVTTSYPHDASDPGGSFIAELAEGLVEARCQVEVVVPRPRGHPDRTEQRGVLVYRGGDTLTHGAEGGGIVPALRAQPSKALRVPSMLRELHRTAARQTRFCDVVHGHWAFPGGTTAVSCGRKLRRPVVVTAHGTDVALARHWMPFRYLLRQSAAKCDRFLAVSAGLRDEVVNLGVDPSRVGVLRMGIRPSAPRPLPQTDAPMQVIYVGALTRNKQVSVLLHALAQLPRAQWELQVVGDGPERTRLEQLVGALGMNGSVHFAGRQAPGATDAAIARAEVLVLPSRSEGLGLVLAEAAQAGLALVASDLPGPRDIVIPGETGFLVKPGNAASLTEALAALATDRTLRVRLGDGARRRVSSMGLGWNAVVQRHIAIYEQLLTSRNG